MAGETRATSTCRRRCRRCSPPGSTSSSPPERPVLERGAVEGEVFHRGAVQALAPEETAGDAATGGARSARSWSGPTGRSSRATTGSASGICSSAMPRTTRCRRRRGPSCTSASPSWLDAARGRPRRARRDPRLPPRAGLRLPGRARRWATESAALAARAGELACARPAGALPGAATRRAAVKLLERAVEPDSEGRSRAARGAGRAGLGAGRARRAEGGPGDRSRRSSSEAQAAGDEVGRVAGARRARRRRAAGCRTGHRRRRGELGPGGDSPSSSGTATTSGWPVPGFWSGSPTSGRAQSRRRGIRPAEHGLRAPRARGRDEAAEPELAAWSAAGIGPTPGHGGARALPRRARADLVEAGRGSSPASSRARCSRCSGRFEEARRSLAGRRRDARGARPSDLRGRASRRSAVDIETPRGRPRLPSGSRAARRRASCSRSRRAGLSSRPRATSPRALPRAADRPDEAEPCVELGPSGDEAHRRGRRQVARREPRRSCRRGSTPRPRRSPGRRFAGDRGQRRRRSFRPTPGSPSARSCALGGKTGRGERGASRRRSRRYERRGISCSADRIRERLAELQAVASERPAEPTSPPGACPPDAAAGRSRSQTDWPAEITREWAWGGATGAGVRVCILDSGVDAGHPLVGARRERGRRLRRRGRRAAIVATDTEGDVCGHGTACAGIVRSLAPEARDPQRPRARPRLHRQREDPARRPPLRDRAGLRRRQHEPLDDEEGLRRRPARARGRRLLPADGARRLRAQHAGRELPVALLVGDLRRQPRGGRPVGALLQPEPAGRVLRARRRTSTSPGWAARRSAAPATASRHRTSPGSAR